MTLSVPDEGKHVVCTKLEIYVLIPLSSMLHVFQIHICIDWYFNEQYFFRIIGDIQRLTVAFREKDAALQKELLDHQGKSTNYLVPWY